MLQTITDNGISAGARHCFLALKEFARGPNWPECFPGKWRLTKELGCCHRQVERYLSELEKSGAIEVIRAPGKKNRFKILLGIKDKIGSHCTDAPTTPMSYLPTTPMSYLPTTPMSGVEDLHQYREAITQQAAPDTEVSAVAEIQKQEEEEMQAAKKDLFGELVKLGMPSTAEMSELVKRDPDLAALALRHFRRRFAGKGKPVNNPGGYIVAFLRHPDKFGFVQVDDEWHGPDDAKDKSSEKAKQFEADRSAAWARERAARQAEADKTYAEMLDVWQRLPESAKVEIRDHVSKSSPLFHGQGADSAEFEFQCMNEVMRISRTNWRNRHLGKPLLTASIASKSENSQEKQKKPKTYRR